MEECRPSSINENFSVIKSTRVDLATSSTAYLLPPYPLPNRKRLIIYNSQNYDLYIGGSDLTVSNGFIIPPGGYLVLALPNNVYGTFQTISATTIRILELA